VTGGVTGFQLEVNACNSEPTPWPRADLPRCMINDMRHGLPFESLSPVFADAPCRFIRRHGGDRCFASLIHGALLSLDQERIIGLYTPDCVAAGILRRYRVHRVWVDP